MKRIILFVALFFIYCYDSFGVDFKFTPLSLSFYSIEAQGDVLATYGTSGSMLISYNNSLSWNKVSIFERGNVVKVFLDNKTIYSFNDCGDYAISTDNGNTWKVSSFINDSVFAVIKYPEGYFVRAKHQLILIDNDLKIKNSYNLFYNPVWLNWNPNNRLYRNSIAYLNGNFIAVADSINKGNVANSTILLMFNDKLNLIDTIIPSKFGLCQNCYGNYDLFTDSSYIYLNLENYIYRSKDFANWVLYQTVDKSYFKAYKLIDNKLFFYNISWYLSDRLQIKLFQSEYPDSAKILLDCWNTQNSFKRYVNDFIINNKKAIFVGNNNFILALNLIDSTTSFYSDYNVISPYTSPERINDSTFMFVAKQSNGASVSYIYLSKDKGITFFPTLDTTNYFLNDFKKPLNYLFNYIDYGGEKIYFIGSNNWYTFKDKGAFISEDFGKTFKFKKIDLPSNNNPLSKAIPNIKKIGPNFVFPINTLGNKSYSFIYTISSNIENLYSFIDSNLVINYVFSKDTNTYLVHCINTTDTTNEIKYTSDKGENWERIKKYSKQDSLLFYKEISFKNKTYLILVNISKIDSIITIDAIDLYDRLVKNIFTCKARYYSSGNKLYIEESIGICTDSNYIYVANNDTLFYSENVNNISKSQYYLFPFNGKIYRTFSKYDNRFYAWYEDSLRPKNLYWIDLSKPTPVTESPKIEFDTYLYYYPPFPLPSHGYIRALVYWDLNSNPDDFIITIYNIKGVKVAGNGDIAFEKISNYSGYIVWDAKNMEKGIYFINIQNKKISNTFKIILD